MRQNGAGIPDTRPYGFLYMTDNESVETKFIAAKLYAKIVGATKTIKSNGFTASDNRFTYTGKRPLTVRAHVIISAKAPENNADISLAIHKNGLELVMPNSSKNTPTKGEGFQLALETVLDLVQGDYIEVFVKNNGSAAPLIVRDLQFRVSE
jgi:hypothetical protein